MKNSLALILLLAPLVLSAEVEKKKVVNEAEPIEKYILSFEALKREEKWDEIITLGETAIPTCTRLGRNNDEVKIRTHLASSFFSRGNFVKAKEHAEKSLALSLKIKDDLGKIRSLYLLSALKRIDAESEKTSAKKRVLYKEARELASRALVSFDEGKYEDEILRAKVLFNLAAAEIENLAAAEDGFRQAIAIYEKIGMHDDCHRATIRLAKVLQMKGQGIMAKEMLEELKPNIKMQRILMHCEFVQAQVEKNLGNKAAAKRLAQSAHQKAEALKADFDLKRLDDLLVDLK